MRQLVSLLADKVTALTAIAGAGARPTLVTDGVDISTFRTGGNFASPMAAVFLVGSQAQQLTSLAGGTEGVELWGYALAQWWLIGVLHDGAPVNIAGASQGFAQVLQDLGDFTRLAVAATISAGTTQYKFGPMESHTY